MTQGLLNLAAPAGPAPPTTCGPCVHRNGGPELALAGCAVTMEQRHRDAPACAFAFGRQQLNGPVYGHSKGLTWPQIINGGRS